MAVLVATVAITVAVTTAHPPATRATAVGCPATPGSHLATTAMGRAGSRPAGWIVAASAIAQMLRTGVSHRLIEAAFSNDHTFVYGPGPATTGVPTAYYTSYASIQAAFADGRLPGSFKAVIYDNERWPQTPVAEQQDPQKYERLTGQLLHQHGLAYIATPAPDLTWSTGNPHEDSYRAFLRRRIPGNAARYANAVDIQGQIRETRLPYFAGFVRRAVQQIRSANPHAAIFIGLRADPAPYTGPAAAQKLEAAYESVAGMGDGYWLNVNGYPKPAACLLQQIYGSRDAPRQVS